MVRTLKDYFLSGDTNRQETDYDLLSLPLNLTDTRKADIEQAIWGLVKDQNTTSDNTTSDDANNTLNDVPAGEETPKASSSPFLSAFFAYCGRELSQAAIPPELQVQRLDTVLSAITMLKSSHNRPKQELCSSLDPPSAVDLGVRLMLMTGCQTPGTHGGDGFRPRWKESQSLVDYVTRIYPRYNPQGSSAGRGQTISTRKLSADYLKSYANINIRWTDHLTDHLLLLKGSNWKSLYIFAHPAFILKSLQTLADAGLTPTTNVPDLYEKSLSNGCLPPALLRETLHTLEIIFPPVGDSRSKRLLAKEVARETLDPALLQPLQFDSESHESPNDVQRVTDIHGLYQRFPYWAARLHELWAEADDPEPTSYIGKYTERKKSPRFMYWCGVLAIVVAVMFGLVSTILAAVQVWISYCDWMDDPAVKWCGLKGKDSAGEAGPGG